MQFINTNMELVIEPFNALPCVLKIFTINGKEADSDDFGSTFDHINGEKKFMVVAVCILSQILQQKKYYINII